jgi:hypothetical protein
MKWKCPACSTAIVHAARDMPPIAGIVYRCHVCHLELTVDSHTDTLALAPLPPPEPPKRAFSI